MERKEKFSQKEVVFIDKALYELLQDLAEKMSKDLGEKVEVEDVIRLSFGKLLEDMVLHMFMKNLRGE